MVKSKLIVNADIGDWQIIICCLTSLLWVPHLVIVFPNRSTFYSWRFLILQLYDCKDILPSFYLLKLPILMLSSVYWISLLIITFRKFNDVKKFGNTNGNQTLLWDWLLMILIYLCSRTQINFTVAIDFTASNGKYYNYH